MNRYFAHTLVTAWMLFMAGSAAAQCQAGMPTVPGAGCVPREYIENQQRGGGGGQQQYVPPEIPGPTYRSNYAPIKPVIEYGAHAMTTDNASLFGATGKLSAKGAEDVVVNFCQERSGKPCRSLGFFKETCQAFVFDQRNTPFKGVDNDPRRAVRQAMTECAQVSGKAQCTLWKLPICAGNDYVGSDYNAGKRWAPGEYEAQVQSWMADAKRGVR